MKKGVLHKKQPQWIFRLKLIPKIEKQVNKIIEAEFIYKVKCLTWIANIILIRKKNGKLCVCVNFWDLNDACVKDDFLLPVTELIIDATTFHEALSFMDDTADYNQIQMVVQD